MRKIKKIFKNKITVIIIVTIFSLISSIIPAEAKTKKVIIGGEAFGLKLYCKGVMITGFELSEDECPAKKSGLMLNDIITKVNGKPVADNDSMYKLISGCGGRPVELEYLRDEKAQKTKLIPQKEKNGKYRAGMWIKDSCAGIGTITYYDAGTKTYGALGHGICDSDTGGLFANSSGEIVEVSITSAGKSDNNNIGTLNGYFTNRSIGTIEKNTGLGIRGKTTKPITKTLNAEIAESTEVKPGKAVLYTTLQDTTPNPYEIEIEEICNRDNNSNKNFIVKITDKSLLEKTGGIVQGMSGSPIVQNGKLVGALTHVFLEDCTIGYGIFARTMMS